MQKTRMGYCPCSGIYRHREISVVTENADPVSRRGFPCHDMVLKLGARPRNARETGMRSRQSFPTLCHDKDLRVATSFSGIPKGVGHERGFLCRDKEFSAPCCDKSSVSRQGVRLG